MPHARALRALPRSSEGWCGATGPASSHGADPRVVGRTIRINEQPHVVVGVMPASFDYLAETEALWVPIAFTPERIAEHDEHYLGVYGRLRDGVTLAQARALADDPGAGPSLLLIDEAAAHLDSVRRAALYDELLANPGQAWLTGTDGHLFEAFGGRAQRFEVREGRVHPAQS